MGKSEGVSRKSVFVLVALLFLLLGLVFLSGGAVTGKFLDIGFAGETLYVPCDDRGAYDFARESFRDYGKNYCVQAANGVVGSNSVEMTGCGDNGNFLVDEWVSKCNDYYAQMP